MAISFGRAALAFGRGVAKGFGEAQEQEKKEKKADERAYLDRYTQAAQNAMRFAETDRRERNSKVDSHRSNLGIITAAIKQTGASDSEARQAAAQLYNQNRTTEGAKLASQAILNSVEDAGSDADARRGIFEGLQATIDPNSTFTLDQYAQSFSGPRTTMTTYMPDMGTFDSRTSLQKLLGREKKEPESITQTREMDRDMGRKEEPIEAVTIPESDIRLPRGIEMGSAQNLADKAYARYLDAMENNRPAAAVQYLNDYDTQMARVQEESILKKAPKDPKAFMSKDDYLKIFTQSGTREVFISQDNARRNIVKETDQDYMGTREGVYRAYKYLNSLSGEDKRRVDLTRENFNAITSQYGFKDAAAQMQIYDSRRLGSASLDVFVNKIQNASVLYKKDPQGEFSQLDPALQSAVTAIYSEDKKAVNAYFEGIREAFFFPPVVGGTENVYYSDQIRNLFPIKG